MICPVTARYREVFERKDIRYRIETHVFQLPIEQLRQIDQWIADVKASTHGH
jgi:hypothetical protein